MPIYVLKIRGRGQQRFYIAFRGDLKFEGRACDAASLPPIRRPKSDAKNLEEFLSTTGGFSQFCTSCDAMNPLYVLDGPTLTLMWLSLLHEYAVWISQPDSKEGLSAADKLRLLEKAEMENEVAMAPVSLVAASHNNLSTSTEIKLEERYTRAEERIINYWAMKRIKRNCPDLDCGSGDCRFSTWYLKPHPEADKIGKETLVRAEAYGQGNIDAVLYAGPNQWMIKVEIPTFSAIAKVQGNNNYSNTNHEITQNHQGENGDEGAGSGYAADDLRKSLRIQRGKEKNPSVGGAAVNINSQTNIRTNEEKNTAKKIREAEAEEAGMREAIRLFLLAENRAQELGAGKRKATQDSDDRLDIKEAKKMRVAEPEEHDTVMGGNSVLQAKGNNEKDAVENSLVDDLVGLLMELVKPKSLVSGLRGGAKHNDRRSATQVRVEDTEIGHWGGYEEGDGNTAMGDEGVNATEVGDELLMLLGGKWEKC